MLRAQPVSCALWVLTIPALVTGCKKPTTFRGTAPLEALTPSTQGSPPLAPPEIDASQRDKVCAESHRATRIVFLVDNSASHGPSGASPGSDPVRRNLLSARNIVEPYTQRQNVLWRAITQTVERDAEAKRKSTSFLGSDAGITAFPKGDSYEGYNSWLPVSGPQGRASNALPNVMTNLTNPAPPTNFADLLWEGLSFTHSPQGATPYLTSLKGALATLSSQTLENDPRTQAVILVTDGLPTDPSPAAVVKFAKENFKAKGIFFATLLVYRSTDAKAEESEAYRWLKGEFEKHKWGTEDGHTSFTSYWNALVTIPNQISDHYEIIPDSSKLREAMDKILGVLQRCN